jgi:3-oxo-5alpha-steroid 4-dehydrogenase
MSSVPNSRSRADIEELSERESGQMDTDHGCDVVVVGYGAAGAAAAIEAADAGAQVLVLDRGYGGGATALSGGVVYAGGGTPHQIAAGLTDSPENMFNYLRQEVQGVVSDATLRRYCETSQEMIAWLEGQGARYFASLCPYKTAYPTDAHYLYYSGNEKAWPYKLEAQPAARGHRMVAKGMSSGHAFFEALRASATAKGVEFKPLSRVHELIIEAGAVVGVRYRCMQAPAPVRRRHRRLRLVADKLTNWVPPVGAMANARAESLWQGYAVDKSVRATAVVLCGGGFVFNPKMKAEYDRGFEDITPLGTVGDDGTVINLGVSAGGTLEYPERMTAWRFLSPPSALLEGISIDPSGTRIANEDLYGATHSRIMIDQHDGRGYLILDANTWTKARRQIPSQTMFFQRLQAAYLFTVGHTRARTLDGLARKIDVPADALLRTVHAYNDGIRSGAGDPYHKAPDLCSPLEQGPFYAIDISIKNSPAYPAPGLTLGGLRVDEATGQVLDCARSPIPGLYAAGRSAVGICSNSYISGLSLGDCIFSGRRAGNHAAATALSAEAGQLAARVINR